MKIILASASKARGKVLKSLGLKFKVFPADIDERKITAQNTTKLVQKIAKAKATAVATDLSAPPPYLIIAADTMVDFEGQTYGKPKSKEEAKKWLKMFSGKTHQFLTGVFVINTKTGKTYQAFHRSKVKFGPFTKQEIEDYVKVAPVTTISPGYSLNLEGSEILRPKIKVIGSVSNVLGLPLEKVLPILKKEAINPEGSLPD